MDLLDKLSIFPYSGYTVFSCAIVSLSVLDSVQPFSLIALSVWVAHFSLSLSLPVAVLTLVLIAVGPAVHTFSVHFIALPSSLVGLASLIPHGSLSFELIVSELSLKYALSLHENTFSMPSIVQKVAIVGTPIRVSGLSASVGLVILPLPLIAVAVPIDVFPKSVSNVVAHVAFIVAAVHSDVATASTATPLNEFSLKVLPVVEFKSSKTMGNVALTFPDIVCF